MRGSPYRYTTRRGRQGADFTGDPPPVYSGGLRVRVRMCGGRLGSCNICRLKKAPCQWALCYLDVCSCPWRPLLPLYESSSLPPYRPCAFLVFSRHRSGVLLVGVRCSGVRSWNSPGVRLITNLQWLHLRASRGHTDTRTKQTRIPTPTSGSAVSCLRPKAGWW